MDDETYYVGREIADAGFANNFDAITEGDSGSPDDGISVSAKDSLIINAKFAANKAMESGRAAGVKDGKAYRGDIEKAVAMIRNNGGDGAATRGEGLGAGSRGTEAAGTLPPAFISLGSKPPVAASAGGGITSQSGGGSMKPEELLAQDKACYEAVFALGEKAALEKERARVSAHITLGKAAGSLETAVKYIESGESSLDEKSTPNIRRSR
jgi:hypothetical protein